MMTGAQLAPKPGNSARPPPGRARGEIRLRPTVPAATVKTEDLPRRPRFDGSFMNGIDSIVFDWSYRSATPWRDRDECLFRDETAREFLVPP